MSTINNINLLGKLKLKSYTYSVNDLIEKLEADSASVIRVNELPTENIDQNAVYIKNKVLNFYDGSNWISVTGKNLKLIPITLASESTADYQITWNERVVTIRHGLNSRVISCLYDPQNRQSFLGVNYVDLNTITIDFTNISVDAVSVWTLCLIAQQVYVGSLGYDYADLLNKPTIPTKTSELTNDSGFLSSTEDVYTKTEADQTFVKLVSGKSLSTNDYTTTEKNKLAGIEDGADANVIESVKVDGTALTITNKAVNIDLSEKANTSDIPTNSSFTLAGLSEKSYNSLTDKPSIPTKISDLTNDSNFVEKDGSKVLSTNDYTTTEKTKLAGIESGANVNVIENVKVNGTALTVTDKAVDVTVPTNDSFTLAGLSEKSYNSLTDKPDLSIKADLVDGKIPASQLPSYVDDVIEGYIDLDNNKFYSNSEKTEEISVESGKIYVDLTSNLQYRFGGTVFVAISSSLALGETADTAFAGNRGKAIEDALDDKVDKVNGKQLSTNDYTTTEKTKLSGIAEGANVNVIESIKVDGAALTITDKAVNIDLSGKANVGDIPTNSDFTLAGLSEKSYNSLTDKPSIPTKISDLTNDSNFVEKDGSKVLSTNDYTTTEKNKLANIAESADVNVIESVKVNGTALTITDKAVDVTVPANGDFTLAGLSEKSYNSLTDKPSIPTKISDLTNDSNFVEKDGTKVLSTNDYTTVEKTKLAGIETGADVNIIESVKVNDVALTIVNKAVNIDLTSKANLTDIPVNSDFTLAGLSEKSYNSLTDKPSIPTKISDLTNDSNFVEKDGTKVLSTNDYTTTEKNKLADIEAGANVNIIESVKVNGTALAINSKTVDIAVPTNNSFTLAGLSEKSYNSLTDKPDLTTKADLVDGKIPASQLPSYVDDVVEGYIDLTSNKFYSDSEKTEEVTVESGKIYIDLTSNLQYRFGGTTFAAISSSLALGETADTAFAGNRGKAVEDALEDKVDKDGSKVLSTNDYTTAEKTKLAGIAESADVNIIESVKVNGTALTITDKAVDVTVPTNSDFTLAGLSEKSYNNLTDKPSIPTKVSDLTNDSEFVKSEDLNDLGIKSIPITSSNSSTTHYSVTWNESTVTVVHNLNSRVMGCLFDTNDEQMFVGINYVNANSVSIDFTNITLTSEDQYTLLLTAQQTYTTPELLEELSVPTKTSQLTNDSGFLTSTNSYTKTEADQTFVKLVSGKSLSTNDYTTAEKTKLAGIAESADVNIIESVKVNGTALTITDKAVDVIIPTNSDFTLAGLSEKSYNNLTDKPTIPTKVSDLTNDSNFITANEITNSGMKVIPITSSDVTNTDYNVTWDTANNIVTINHKLNSRVLSALFNPSNNQMMIGVNYVDDNNVSIDFANITVGSGEQYNLVLTAQHTYVAQDNNSIIYNGTITSGSYTANYTNGNVHLITCTENSSIAVSNIPIGRTLLVRIVNSSGYTITYNSESVISTAGTYYLTFKNIIGTAEMIGDPVKAR